MAQKEIKRAIINKINNWQALAAGKWNNDVQKQMDILDKEIDALYELVEDKKWNWYDGVG